MDRLAKRVQKNLEGKVAGVVINPKGEAKMSEVLEAYIEPYLDATKNRDQRLKLSTIAAFAWNLTLLPEDKQQQEKENLIEQLGGQNRQVQQDIREILEELMERKRKFFAKIKRHIIDFELKESRNDFHLSVISSLIPEEPK